MTGSRLTLLRLLLLLVTRLRRSVGRIAFAIKVQFSSLWKTIVAFAGRPGSQLRLHANNVSVGDDDFVEERSQVPERVTVKQEGGGTLAALPVRRTADWRDDLPTYQALTSSYHFKFDAIQAATPDIGSQRYKTKKVGQSFRSLNIPAGQRKLLSALPALPNGWTQHVHPEGNVIFYHEGLRIFTESDVTQFDKEIFFYATELIQQATETEGVTLDELTEIVLNIDDDRRWYYYFVDHRHRLLFWVGDVDAREGLGMHLQKTTGFSHISTIFGRGKVLYIVYNMELRMHCEYYPHNRTLPKGVFDDLRGMLNYARTDLMTADSSTSPFEQDELVAISDLINSLKDDSKISDPYNIWAIARITASFSESDNRFLNFCGQPCARLNADTPLFGKQTWNRSKVFKAANVFLFGSPNDHAVRLERVWVDGIIIQPRWKDFINRLTTELARYTIFSTVMLAVNFSFLAVPGVVPAGSPASRIQIIIYCSVVSTIGSIIFSLALLNVYSAPGLMDASPAAEAMKMLSQWKFGMACLAITHSLPISCLIWSIALFSTAFAVQIFGPKERPTVATLSVECFILVLLGIMSIIVLWLFARDDGVDDLDALVENDLSYTGLQPDIEDDSGT